MFDMLKQIIISTQLENHNMLNAQTFFLIGAKLYFHYYIMFIPLLLHTLSECIKEVWL